MDLQILLKYNGMKKYFSLFIAILTISCTFNVDVTDDPNFYFGYQKGQIYIVKLPLYILNRPNNHIVIPGESYPEIDEYQKNSAMYNEIRGIIEAHEKIRIEKLIYRESFEDSYLKVYGRVVKGRYEGEIVNLNSISIWGFKPYPMGGSIVKPDPEILKLIE
jgi:hypothetical protein